MSVNFSQKRAPVILEPIEPVCACKVSKAEKRILWELLGGIEEQNLCSLPLCKNKVKPCEDDPVAEKLARLSIESLSPSSKKEEASPKSSVKAQADVKEKNEQEIPFPGEKAEFILKGDWDTYNSGGPLVKYMPFFTTSKNSAFRKFALLGYRNGDAMVSLTFREKYQKRVSSYFGQFGILIDPLDMGFILLSGSQAKIIVSIFINQLPKEYRSFIQSLVEAGDWRKVPFKKEEIS